MTWDDFTDKVPEEDRVGYRIKVKGKWLLIGDINTLGGVCDDCMFLVRCSSELEEIIPPNAPDNPDNQLHPALSQE